MGLDMYLYAERYLGVWSHDSDVWSHDSEEATKNEWNYRHILKLAGFPDSIITDTNDGRSLYVKVTVGYWRKANAIHAWFVKHVQDGKDECQISHVEGEQLMELRTLCRHLLEQKDPREAAEKLPPQGGFFFGGTEIDPYYWRDLENTVRILDRILTPEWKYCSFYYHSSW